MYKDGTLQILLKKKRELKKVKKEQNESSGRDLSISFDMIEYKHQRV